MDTISTGGAGQLMTIRVHLGELLRLTDSAGRQIPYAASVALTKVARDAREELVRDLGHHFTVRAPWTGRGIRYRPARKHDLTARIGSRDEYMRRQALGGYKAGGVGIPIAARPTVRSITRRSRWPGRLLEKGRSYIAPAGGGRLGVWTRKGRRGRGKRRLQWILAERVRVEPRWPLLHTVEHVARRRWADHAVDALTRALLTAR